MIVDKKKYQSAKEFLKRAIGCLFERDSIKRALIFGLFGNEVSFDMGDGQFLIKVEFFDVAQRGYDLRRVSEDFAKGRATIDSNPEQLIFKRKWDGNCFVLEEDIYKIVFKVVGYGFDENDKNFTISETELLPVGENVVVVIVATITTKK